MRIVFPVTRFLIKFQPMVWIVLPSLLLFVACDDGGQSPPQTAASFVDGIATVASPQDDDIDASVIATDAEDDVKGNGGVMHVEIGFRGIDPVIDAASAHRDLYNLPLVSEIHAGLMSISRDSVGMAKPELAESFVVRDDGRFYEFRLRKGLKFSDGSRLTASDVKWSWERALKKSTPWGRATDVFGSILGADAVAAGTVDDLIGVEVIDDKTLAVTLTAPRPDFQYLLSDPVASVLKRENVEKWHVSWTNDVFPSSLNGTYEKYSPMPFGEDNMPVGAGPFKLVEYLTQTEICSIARNEHYWGRPAHLDGVRYISAELYDTETAQEVDLHSISERAFFDERIDFVLVFDDRADDLLQKSKGTNTYVQSVESAPFTQFLVFNPAHPPFDDHHFRRALMAASNLEEMYAPLPVKWEHRLVPPSILHTLMPVNSLIADLESARSELTLSEYAENVGEHKSTFFTETAGFVIDRLQILFDVWRESLGFDVELRSIDTAELLFGLMDYGELPIREISISPLYPSPHAVLGSFVNVFGRSEPSAEFQEVEEMIAEASAEPDAATRSLKYRDIEQHILDQALALPLLVDWFNPEILVQPWVHNFNPPRFPGSAFHGVWFDDTAPDRALP